ncbi:MAG: hypothetical protein HUK22_06365, partial [Thermoguttaceae bacterium]|nr:hypothetical protein [Thermoguttaceae bacterium]
VCDGLYEEGTCSRWEHHFCVGYNVNSDHYIYYGDDGSVLCEIFSEPNGIPIPSESDAAGGYFAREYITEEGEDTCVAIAGDPKVGETLRAPGKAKWYLSNDNRFDPGVDVPLADGALKKSVVIPPTTPYVEGYEDAWGARTEGLYVIIEYTYVPGIGDFLYDPENPDEEVTAYFFKSPTIAGVYERVESVSLVQDEATGNYTIEVVPAAAEYTATWSFVGGGAPTVVDNVYTPDRADAGKQIKVVVEGTGEYTGTATTYSPTLQFQISAPTIQGIDDGAVYVGDLVAAQFAEGETGSANWKVKFGPVTISESAGYAYTVPADAFCYGLELEVAGTGGFKGTASTSATVMAKIDGISVSNMTPKFGDTLYASASCLVALPSVNYTWTFTNAEGDVVKTESGASYSVGYEDVGLTITLSARTADSHYKVTAAPVSTAPVAWPEGYVTTEAELLDAVANHQVGGKIVIANDIYLTSAVQLDNFIGEISGLRLSSALPWDFALASAENARIFEIGAGSIVTLKNLEFFSTQVSTTKDGGIVYTNSPLRVESCYFSRGNAKNGGAIFANQTDLTLSDVTFEGNNAYGYGGAVFGYKSNLTVADSTFKDNWAMNSGAGIYFYGARQTMLATGGVFSGNRAMYGGGIYADAGDFTINGVTMSLNVGSQGGGAIFQRSGSMTLDNSYIAGNISGSSYGDISLYSTAYFNAAVGDEEAGIPGTIGSNLTAKVYNYKNPTQSKVYDNYSGTANAIDSVFAEDVDEEFWVF